MRWCVLWAAVACVASGCAKTVCDRAEDFDPPSKTGDCQAVGKALGARCGAALDACGEDDRKALDALVDCLEALPVCASADEAGWRAQYDGCYQAARAQLSEACAQRLSDHGFPPADAGSGPVDAGRQPENGAVTLVAVGDEDKVAFAWTSSRLGQVHQWELNVDVEAPGGATRLPEVLIPASAQTRDESGVPLSAPRGYFIAGLTPTGQVAVGVPIVEDAGTQSGCRSSLDCADDQVCSLGTCQIQACTSTSQNCPGGYACNASISRCTRVSIADAGANAGPLDGGVAGPLPMISERVWVRTGDAGYSTQVFVTPTAGREPDVVAFDSARQYVALEQNTQLLGHLTLKRGADYPLGAERQPSQIDTIGTRVRLAYVSDGEVLYACYNVGNGVRVRRSRDFGRTWGSSSEAIDFVNPPTSDGGFPARMRDCDVAPWLSGGAMLVLVDGDTLVVHTVDSNLVASAPTVVLQSSEPGVDPNLFNPERPAIATLPSAQLVHIGFTASRKTQQGNFDQDVYGIFRDAAGGAFTSPSRMNAGLAYPQDHVALAVDPKTQRGIAAFTSMEDAAGQPYSTVYVALFDNASKTWGTGSDLSVFTRAQQSLVYDVIPERPTTEAWNAFSPNLAVTPAGKIFLSFAAGLSQGVPSYQVWSVRFDLTAKNGLGWFVPPAKRVGSGRVADSKSVSGPPATWTAMAADGQLSVYVVGLEATGLSGTDPGRALFWARP